MRHGANAVILGRKYGDFSYFSLFTKLSPIHRIDRLTASAEELSKVTGRTCIAIQADVRQPKTLHDAVAKTIEKFGHIDFVICGTYPLARTPRRRLFSHGLG